jgi:urease gamma subunit
MMGTQTPHKCKKLAASLHYVIVEKRRIRGHRALARPCATYRVTAKTILTSLTGLREGKTVEKKFNHAGEVLYDCYFLASIE